ncbi:hypothetical protein EI94DRAFT_1703589 [Lactarius quietus]|nr:hypothetical protein EI94DRAFT_1703589 [Lactarius quietus]
MSSGSSHHRHLVRSLRCGPVLLAFSTSEGINILRNTTAFHSTLQRSAVIRAILSHIEAITIPCAEAFYPNANAPSFDIAGMATGYCEVLAQGVWIAHARHLRSQELVKMYRSIRLVVTAALLR